jgi:hypothetical protein
MENLPFADVQTHANVVTSKLRKGISVNSFLSGRVDFHLQITGGLLDATTANLCGKHFQIGSDFDADINLLDDHIDPQHCEFFIQPSVFGPVGAIRALGQNVVVDGQALVPGTTSDFQALPVALAIGEVSVVFETRSNEPRLIKVNVRKRKRFAAIAAAVLVLAIAFIQFTDVALYDFQIELQDRNTAAIDPAEIKNALVARTNDVLITATAKLNELGLGEFVRIEEFSAGSLRASGTLRSDKQRDWHAFQIWYDMANNPVLISSVSVAPDFNDFPPIASIKMTAPRRLNLTSGRRIVVGDVVSEGLILESIEDGFLRLSRNGEEIRMAFAE